MLRRRGRSQFGLASVDAVSVVGSAAVGGRSAVIWASLVDDPSGGTSLTPDEQEAERQRLFGILERLVEWENSNNPDVLAEVRAEVDRCFPDGPPPILDSFAGEGLYPTAKQTGHDAPRPETPAAGRPAHLCVTPTLLTELLTDDPLLGVIHRYGLVRPFCKTPRQRYVLILVGTG